MLTLDVNATAQNLCNVQYLMKHRKHCSADNYECILWTRKRIKVEYLFNSIFGLGNKMLKRQTNKLITVECFLTLHSLGPISVAWQSGIFLLFGYLLNSAALVVKLKCDKFNNQYFSNFN